MSEEAVMGERDYSFREVWDERFKRMEADMAQMRADVRDQGRMLTSISNDFANIKGKMVVWGTLGLAIGGVLTAVIIKGLGIG